MPAALHTARLRLDPWADGDLGLLARLARTPAVMRHIGDGTTWTDARIHDVGARIVAQGAAAVRDEAFQRVGAPSILARIAPVNAASLAVAAAIGLRHDCQSTGRGGETIAVLRLTAPQWREISSGPGSPRAAEPGAPA